MAFDSGLKEKTARHPCYSGGCKTGRIHLPVAPACNISCNYCNRRYDCVNESRPGVASEILTPQAAAAKYIRVKAAMPELQVVGIAGPGDALANFGSTAETFRLIRNADPEVVFCLSTNGLLLEKYAAQIAELGVSHVTITINTVDPQIGKQIYREVNYEGVKYTGAEGAALLLEKQLAGLVKLRDLGLVTKINTVLIKGVNDMDIVNVARLARQYEVYIGNVMQLIPAPGSFFEHMPLTTNSELNEVRKDCEAYVRQMYHCQQCRADAIGFLGQDRSAEFREIQKQPELTADGPPQGSFTVLVTSGDRRIVNQHFGHADKFYIYRYEDGAIRLLEIRETAQYCEGVETCGDEDKIIQITKAASDCDVILTQRIGDHPRKILEDQGKLVISSYGFISEEIQKAALTYLTAPKSHKLAVATSDGQTINVHFGQAQRFAIYQIYEGGYKYLRDIFLPPAPEDTPRGNALEKRIHALQDVDTVLINQIGEQAKKQLLNNGIAAYAVSGDIDKALTVYSQRLKIIEKLKINKSYAKSYAKRSLV